MHYIHEKIVHLHCVKGYGHNPGYVKIALITHGPVEL